MAPTRWIMIPNFNLYLVPRDSFITLELYVIYSSDLYNTIYVLKYQSLNLQIVDNTYMTPFE